MVFIIKFDMCIWRRVTVYGRALALTNGGRVTRSVSANRTICFAGYSFIMRLGHCRRLMPHIYLFDLLKRVFRRTLMGVVAFMRTVAAPQ